jgi:dTDP-4-dehydrorhamnose reductase
MRVLVIGANGMMGHMACRVLAESHEVYGSIRGSLSGPLVRFLSADRCVEGLDTDSDEAVRTALATVHPDAVLNCVGIVKQLAEAKNAILSIQTNSLLPHRLAESCHEVGARLVHLSTDCVFSGRRGNYTEADLPDPVDLYGRSKLLGETAEGEALTIRTSIVGRQIGGDTSLFEWAIANRNHTVRGFDRAIYSGLTTMALSRIISTILVEHADLSGVWQIASEPITKFRLLQLLDERLGLGMTIERDETFECDRSLDGSAFTAATGIVTPSWDEMLDEFRDDQAAYA